MNLPIELLVETYQNNLYAVAFHICKNAHDAEDVVQDTFIQYLSHKQEFASEAHIRAWLIRVAINKAKNKTTSFSAGTRCPWKTICRHCSFPRKSPLHSLRQ